MCVGGFLLHFTCRAEMRMRPLSGWTAGRYVVIGIPHDLLLTCCFLVHIPFRPQMQMRPLGGGTVARGKFCAAML